MAPGTFEIDVSDPTAMLDWMAAEGAAFELKSEGGVAGRWQARIASYNHDAGTLIDACRWLVQRYQYIRDRQANAETQILPRQG